MRAILTAAASIALLVAPFALYPVFLMEAMCYAMFASAFNLLFGYAGLLSFGHAAFFGFAAYTAGYSVKHLAMSPEVALLIGVTTGAAFGLAIGLLAIRQRGIYFSMITFALAEMVYFLAVQAPFTGGEDGLQSIPRGRLFGLLDLNSELTMYYVVLTLFAVVLAACYRVVNSPFGAILLAIRENEMRAISLGYEVAKYKLLAFVLSAGLAGLAGALKALCFHFASLNNVHWHQSGEVVLMTLIGGVGTLLGPVVGAVFIISLQHYLAELGDWVTFVTGAIFVFCVLFFRKGFVGELHSYMKFKPWRISKRAVKLSDA